jgi:sarcosine oxidase gamma subunit
VPSYDLIVFSTFLTSFLESLTHAAEETGYVVR